MTGSAAALEDPARWLGVVIAVLGALAANPDATAHGWNTFWGQVQQGARRSRGYLARFIPALRKIATVQEVSATLSASLGGVSVSARGIVGWGPRATLDQQIAMLDARTRSLDKELGELGQTVSQMDTRMRAELADAVRVLRGEAGNIRKSVEELRLDIVHSDASALPIIVVGFALTGLAPDAASVPMWLGLLALVAAVGLTGWFSLRIFRPRAR
jgi:hypothetical protein